MRRLALAAALAAAACRSPAEVRDRPQESRACPQTYEFGNTGCADVVGQVVGLRGQPLVGIWVTARAIERRATFGGFDEGSDPSGDFRVRLTRVDGRPPAAGPDTATVWLVGVDPRSSTVNVPATVRDSVRVLVTISPVGAVPEPSVVRLTLPAP